MRDLLRPEIMVFLIPITALSIPIVAIIVGGVIKVYRMRLTARYGADFSKKGGSKMSVDDIRTIQELHKGFEKLNERIEALETILLDRARKG